MLLMNVTPGPFLLRDNPQVFWGVIGSFYVGNVMLLLLNLPLVGLFARVATIPARYLMPGVLVVCAVAAYSDNNNVFDVWVMVAAGILGWAMRGLGYNPAPLVLGLVLGPLLKRSLLQALTIARGDVRGLVASVPAAIMLARRCWRSWRRRSPHSPGGCAPPTCPISGSGSLARRSGGTAGNAVELQVEGPRANHRLRCVRRADPA
jgi:TctA family transporter